MVCLDGSGDVVRDALLWNDTRSADAAAELVEELGGPAEWAKRIGVVPVAAITATKLRWLADHEPAHADATAAVCLPHDWLTWRLTRLDRYRRPAHRPQRCQRHRLLLRRRPTATNPTCWSWRCGAAAPRCRRCSARMIRRATRQRGAARPGGRRQRGGGAGPGRRTRGLRHLARHLGSCECGRQAAPHDPEGIVAGFADATGRQLPLVCTLNGAPVLAAVATMLGVDFGELDRLALSAPAGAEGLTLVPYLDGERSPNLPRAAGALQGMTTRNLTSANVARAAVEGLLSSMAFCMEKIATQGVTSSGSSWSAVAHVRRPSGASHRRSGARPSMCRRPPSTLRSAPRDRRHGRSRSGFAS